jgi:hypothetical protein
MTLPSRLILSPTVVGANTAKRYTTEAQLLAATPSDGTIAYALDTDTFYLRVDSAWAPYLGMVTTRVAGPITLTSSHQSVFCDTDTAGVGFELTLPAGVDGKWYRIINCGSSGYDVTITPDGSENLLGANASQTLADGNVIDLVYETTMGWW